MEEVARVSWKSGGGVSLDWVAGVLRDSWVEPGGVGETSISRHWRVGVVVLLEGEELSVEEGASDLEAGTETSSKAWMGRASKNSWATMKGIFGGAIEC